MVARVNGTVPRLLVAPGRKGFKAELEELRERMRGLGLGHGQIAGEIARRYRLRPREAYRLAHGWTLGQAAAQFNARAADLGTDPGGLASLAGNRLCEYEHWPLSERRPSVYVLVMLANIYQAGVMDLLDLADHEHLPPRDRLTLLQAGQPVPSGPGLSTPTGEARDIGHPGTVPPGLMPGPPLASAQGMSLSLPYVPGRLVIEVTDPALSAGQHGGEAAPAVTGLAVQTPWAAVARPPRTTAGAARGTRLITPPPSGRNRYDRQDGHEVSPTITWWWCSPCPGWNRRRLWDCGPRICALPRTEPGSGAGSAHPESGNRHGWPVANQRLPGIRRTGRRGTFRAVARPPHPMGM
jgi:hypothetical protein